MYHHRMTLSSTYIHHHYIDVPSVVAASNPAWSSSVATIVNNMMTLNYLPHREVVEALSLYSATELLQWWMHWEPVLQAAKGADKSYRSAMVYKNFPQEVLSMDESDAVFTRLGSAWSVIPSIPQARDYLKESEGVVPLTLLRHVKADTSSSLLDGYWTSAKSWSVEDVDHVLALYDNRVVDLATIGFKDNAWALVARLKEQWGSHWMEHVRVHTATDVVRLAQALSGGDLKALTKFKKWSRAERRVWVQWLDGMTHLEEDVARLSSVFKKFLGGLHVHEYKNAHTLHAVAKKLASGELLSYEARVEHAFDAKDVDRVCALLSQRPGMFVRMLNRAVQTFGASMVDSFVKIVPGLSIRQKIDLDAYLSTFSERQYRTFAPKGRWLKLQVRPNDVAVWPEDVQQNICNAVREALRADLLKKFPQGVCLHDAERLRDIRFMSNGQENGRYGRGTRMKLPEGVTCVRSATFWTHPSTVYADNGWSFLDENYNILGTCCWNAEFDMKPAAIFSGDAVTANHPAGSACQMIDLYLEPLKEKGVRYALWTVFSYSQIPFDELDLTANLQFATDGSLGDVYEPSRVAISFPVKGTDLSRYVLLLDVEKREWVYLDARLKSDVGSLNSFKTRKVIQEQLPAYLEYVDGLPSVYDVLQYAPVGTLDVMMNDKDVTSISTEALVIHPENPELSYKNLSIDWLLED